MCPQTLLHRTIFFPPFIKTHQIKFVTSKKHSENEIVVSEKTLIHTQKLMMKIKHQSSLQRTCELCVFYSSESADHRNQKLSATCSNHGGLCNMQKLRKRDALSLITRVVSGFPHSNVRLVFVDFSCWVDGKHFVLVVN